jgi:hypothetical protein
MKINWKPFSVIVLALIFVFAAACSKDHSQKVATGVWKVVNVADISNPNSEKWEFFNDGRLNVYFLDSAAIDTLIEYNYKYSFPKYNKLDITPTNDTILNFYCRSWDVNKLNNKVMILDFEEQGLFIKEFEKE